jgi:hypothetical protein
MHTDFAKGGKSADPNMQRIQKNVAEKINEINLPFEDEFKIIEEDS